MNPLDKSLDLAGRCCLAAIFLVAGVGKVGQYARTQECMAAAGIPGTLLPLVVLLEIGGALAITCGWQTRYCALAVAAFSVAAAFLFHTDFERQMQLIMFLKNIAIAGGFLLLSDHGAGPWSLDAHRSKS